MRKRFFREMDGTTARLSSSIRTGRFTAVLFAAAIWTLLGGPATAQLPCSDPRMFLRFHPESFRIPVGAQRWGHFSAVCREGSFSNRYELIDLDAGPGFNGNLITSSLVLRRRLGTSGLFNGSIFIISCPVTARGPEIVGEEGGSGEGQPGTCGTPPGDDNFGVADLLLVGAQGAILHRLVPACCVEPSFLPTEDPVPGEEPRRTPSAHFIDAAGKMRFAVNGTARSLLRGEEPFGANLGRPTQTTVEVEVIDNLHEFFASILALDGQELDPSLETNSPGPAARAALSAANPAQEIAGVLTISGPPPWVEVTGNLMTDGSFDLRGEGLVAGRPNIGVRFEGRMTPGGFHGRYTIGANGGLPTRPGVYEFRGRFPAWETLWTTIGQTSGDLANDFAQAQFFTPIGGLDWTGFSFDVVEGLAAIEAGGLLREAFERPAEEAETAERTIEAGGLLRKASERRADQAETAERPIEDGLGQLSADVAALAGQAATSSLASRAAVEASLRQAAAQFATARGLMAEVNRQSSIAPTPAVRDAVVDWLNGLGAASASLETAGRQAFGTMFTTVPASSFDDTTVAPDSIVSGFGQLGAPLEQAASVPLPTELGGISVLIIDSAHAESLAGLFVSTGGQVNYHIPAETAEGIATIMVLRGTEVVASGNVLVQRVVPGLFSANASGTGVAAAAVLRVQDGAQTSELIFSVGPGGRQAIPVDLGGEGVQTFLILFGSGFRNASQVTVKIGGQDAQTAFAASSEFVGVDQANALLDRGLIGRGTVDIELAADGIAANVLTMLIQ